MSTASAAKTVPLPLQFPQRRLLLWSIPPAITAAGIWVGNLPVRLNCLQKALPLPCISTVLPAEDPRLRLAFPPAFAAEAVHFASRRAQAKDAKTAKLHTLFGEYGLISTTVARQFFGDRSRCRHPPAPLGVAGASVGIKCRRLPRQLQPPPLAALRHHPPRQSRPGRACRKTLPAPASRRESAGTI